MTTLSLDKVNSVYCRVNCAMGEALELKEFFSVYANNYKWHPKYRSRIWNGKISYFNIGTRELPIGLLSKFHSFCNKFGYKYKFNFPKEDLYNTIDKQTIRDFADGLTMDYGISARDYQVEQVHSAINHKRGVILSPTASGKSLSIYLLIRLLLTQKKDRKILLVVPNVMLVEQMVNDFTSYGWEDSFGYITKLYSGQEPDFDKNVLVSTWQSLQHKGSNFFKKYEALLVDEVHGAKAFQIQQISKHCTNCQYRIGTTGTMPTSDADTYSINGYIGPVIWKTTSSNLIDKGVLSRLSIVNLLLKYPKAIRDKNKGRPYPEEIRTINEYKPRNKALKYIIDNVPDRQNFLILCTEIDHLKSIQEYLEEKLDEKYMVVNIYGKTKPEEREQIRQLMESEENVILVATYATLSTGVNIKKLHNVIFASSTKSYIRCIQSIGRGLRKHKDKTIMVLWDLVDVMIWRKRTGNMGENYVFTHWKERLKYYKEQGFQFFDKPFRL